VRDSSDATKRKQSKARLFSGEGPSHEKPDSEEANSRPASSPGICLLGGTPKS